MSRLKDEKFRPELHLSSTYGWVNDPNGLIFVDGVYHVFYQHDPNSTKHGPMHWGHATSTDLVNWVEHPVALYPDENGTCFSGCAIEDEDGQVKLIYTSHRLDDDGKDFQQQCLVHVDREITRFDKDVRNPVVKNSGLGCFRDPKVFWHSESSRWVMALAHGETVGQSIGFHSSNDLVNWRFESSFGETYGRHGDGPWECPDLLRMKGPEGDEHWVLVAGIGNPAYAPGSGTMYFIGHFDGKEFKSSNPPETELWLDHGRDYYAAQSFFGAHADAPLVLAWSNNWKYAQQTPTNKFRGLFSLPRHLELVDTPDGLRLSACVPDTVRNAFPELALGELPKTPNSGAYLLSGAVSLRAGDRVKLTLFGAERPQFVFSSNADGQAYLQQYRDEREGMNEFAHEYSMPLGNRSELQLEVFVDNGVVELNVDKLFWTTNVYYPEHLDGEVTLVRSFG